MEVARAVDAVRGGLEVSDAEFDLIYPTWIRELSRCQWTPVSVAKRAVGLLTDGHAKTAVLDVGSGVGKLCLIGALTTGATFVGIEQRADLVDAARAAAKRAGATRAIFVHGSAADIDWNMFEGIYLYNPFQEEIPAADAPPTAATPLAPAQREAAVRMAFDRLCRARVGTRVVTFHGYGGAMPLGYRRRAIEGTGVDLLELWVKTVAVNTTYFR